MEESQINSMAIMDAYHWLISECSAGHAQFKKRSGMVFFELGYIHLSLNFAIASIQGDIALLARKNRGLEWFSAVPWSEINFNPESKSIFMVFYSLEVCNPLNPQSTLKFPSFSIEIKGSRELYELIKDKTKILLGFFSVSDIISKEIITNYNLNTINYG